MNICMAAGSSPRKTTLILVSLASARHSRTRVTIDSEPRTVMTSRGRHEVVAYLLPCANFVGKLERVTAMRPTIQSAV
jgi:hypothetical protein